ncbi:MAG: arginine--tRNA ligase, partial [Deltaproteobacteria bacterium]|nr:arginine--tRNA ligase [Deltaproteobacteria bacterium]
MIATVADIVKKAIENCKKAGDIKTEELPDIVIEKPKRDEFGDFATNAAMLLASKEEKPPRQIAELIAREIRRPSSHVKKVDVAGPGFINIFMEDGYWFGFLKDVHGLKQRYGTADIGAGAKIQIEFVSANPTGPLHIGHGRGAAVGDSLANILKATGFDVTKEYYVNDAGRQVRILGESVRRRYDEEFGGKKAPFPEDFYKGDYVKEVARDYWKKYSNTPQAVSTITFQEFACKAMLERIKKDLKDFGVEFDNWFSEKKELRDNGLVMTAINELEKKGFIFSEDDAQWFRTMQFGDDKNRVLSKADGELTYFASDVAYHREKMKRGFSTIV